MYKGILEDDLDVMERDDSVRSVIASTTFERDPFSFDDEDDILSDIFELNN